MGINPLLNKENAMLEKNNKVKKVSKKQLLTEISELTGKTPKELDSLSRSNLETITWIKSLVS
jgi:hypothetical protein